MSKVATVGSRINAEGGFVTQGLSFCRVEGSPISHVGCQGTEHPCEGGNGGAQSGAQSGAGGRGGHYGGPGDTTGPNGPPPDGGGVATVPDCVHKAGEWAVSRGSSFVKVEGRPVASTGSSTSCGHVVVSGKFVTING